MEKWGRKLRGNIHGIDPNNYETYEAYRRACKTASDREHSNNRYHKNPNKQKEANNKYREKNKELVSEKRKRYAKEKQIKEWGDSQYWRREGYVACLLSGKYEIKTQYRVYLSEEEQKEVNQSCIVPDIYIEELRTFVEYNGPHHYGIKTNYAYGPEKLQQVQRRDEFFRKWCIKNNYKLIEINGNKYTSAKAIQEHLEQIQLL